MFDDRRTQRGIALAYVGVFVFMMALMVGLAVDLGRAYAVRLELAKAVDAAALAAARVIINGTTAATNEANAIFTLNFPSGHLGVDSVSTPDINFASVSSGPNAGAHLITVSASATLSTTFMALAGNDTIDIPAAGQATRRLVDIAFVIDHSGSLSGVWSQVQTAANRFVDFFDEVNDRMALVMFAYDAVVPNAISTSRGYNKANIKANINLTQAEGATSTAEGLFRGWDQLRRVPTDIQSGLRVIVLFTDGAPNTFAGTFRRRAVNNSTDTNWSAQLGSIVTGDFPPGSPSSQGLRTPYSATCCSTLTNPPSCITPGGCWNSDSPASAPLYNSQSSRIEGIPQLPNASTHAVPQSTGIADSFLLQTTGLSGQRTLILETTDTTAPGHPYGSHPNNVSKAARNLAERIANEIRTDTSGAHPMRIYALGLGNLLNTDTGVQPAETGSTILRRIANDPASGSFVPTQPEGKYYFAGSATELNDAFQQIRDQIIRISQ